MNNYKRFSSAAFTLIELSFVILIIGVLIAAIVLGKNLISRSKISNAQTLAQSSSVLSIPELRMWIETSLDRSFKPNEMVDGGSITTWNDINPIASKVSVSSVGSGPNRPTYSTVHTINSIPGVWFQNSASDYLKIDDASFLNNTDYTICVSEKRESNAAGNYFIGDTTVTTSNQNLLLGYLADGTVIHSQAGTTVAANTNTYSSSVELFASSKMPRVFCFIQDSVAGKKSTYINGILAATSNNTSKLSNITSLSIGRSYSGVIGEVIIFTKALNLAEINTVKDSFFANLFISEAFAQTNNISEMQSVMGYMGKKLIIPIAPKGTSCVGGAVTGSSCDITTCNVTTANVTQSSVSQGSGALTCSAGYTGSPTYTCASGTFTPGGSACTGISCPVSVTGVSSPSSVGYTPSSTSMSCNAAGYSGSVNYTCTTGTLSVTGSCTSTCGSTSYQVFTSGSSYTLPAGSCTVKVWAIGGGGGAAGATSNDGDSGGGGGAGGVVYRTYTVTAGQSVSYSIASGGSGGSGAGNGSSGGSTSATVNGITITAFGGSGGQFNNGVTVGGGSYSGGDGGANGGSGVGIASDAGGPGGGAIGGVSGSTNGSSGGTGANSADVSGLFAALSAAGYSTSSGGAGSPAGSGGSNNAGASASGFGCGGGGAGYWGGSGGSGIYGGGGGGASGYYTSPINWQGGYGGNGAVVIKLN